MFRVAATCNGGWREGEHEPRAQGGQGRRGPSKARARVPGTESTQSTPRCYSTQSASAGLDFDKSHGPVCQWEQAEERTPILRERIYTGTCDSIQDPELQRVLHWEGQVRAWPCCASPRGRWARAEAYLCHLAERQLTFPAGSMGRESGGDSRENQEPRRGGR